MAAQHILQVSELTKKVKFMLESELNTVWLCGEISNFIAASSGHWYLSLKDSKSQVKCAMFKGRNSRVRISPRNGQQVLVRAKVSLYEPRGDFQLIIEQMEDEGEGLLRQQFDELKKRLSVQGLFSSQFKQTLPSNITRVGVITSPTGAAIKDILTVLNRRNPSLAVIIYPALVQGEQAKFEIEKAIDNANNREECDVLIVGRGGGSLEDLWAFNEEIVVNAIFHSRIPTISAVGHEIDTTLSDYVADIRAATPSAAAEIVAKDINETITQLNSFSSRLQLNILQKLKYKEAQLSSISHRLKQVHPEQKLQVHQQRIDELSSRLLRSYENNFKRFQINPKNLSNRLNQVSPLHRVLNYQNKVELLTQRLSRAFHVVIQKKEQRFAKNVEQLNMMSPLATIARGYSITRNDAGIVKHVDEIAIDDTISIQLNDGSISAKVIEKNKR